MEKVRHPNVVQFVGAVTQNIPMMIVSEYHPKVTILSLPLVFALFSFRLFFFGRIRKTMNNREIKCIYIVPVQRSQ